MFVVKVSQSPMDLCTRGTQRTEVGGEAEGRDTDFSVGREGEWGSG